MIKREGINTEVQFGTGNNACISVNSEGGKLILQMLSNKKSAAGDAKIGDRLEPEDIKDAPKVELHFYNEKSLDVLICHLEAIRKRITPPPTDSCDQLALAC